MTKSRNEGPHGLAVVDKPPGWTSHDVVAKARGLLGTRKVGHSGTLDPDATGVLLLGVGKVTRLLRYLGYPEKRYTRRRRPGHGDVHPRRVRRGHRHLGHAAVPLDDVAGGGSALTGDILQIPPMVSAIQVDGRASTSWPARASRWSASPGPSRSTASPSASRSHPGCFPIEVDLLVGHLHPHRSPPTSAPPSAAAPTCATSAAPPSAPSPSTRPWRSRR